MDFKDQIKQIAERVCRLKDQVLTEEATKNALIMPFIQALGYDVFNPLEVVPEYVTDVSMKKGEKIDYAILRDDIPVILIECKHWAQNLDLHDGQLMRYFHVSQARFAILSNGIIYRFYSDLVDANIMDEKPFLEFNITEIKENQIEELKKFHKSNFNTDQIVNAASELKYSNELKRLIQQELNAPSAEFVRYFAKQIYPRSLTAKVVEQFSVLVKKTGAQLISDIISDRLKSALNKEEEESVKEHEKVIVSEEESPKVVTTETEIEAYMIVKAILRQKVSVSRVYYRDAQNYFSIILDDNNRKPICRFYFNSSKKYIATFDSEKVEKKREISALDDIYGFTQELLSMVDFYEK